MVFAQYIGLLLMKSSMYVSVRRYNSTLRQGFHTASFIHSSKSMDSLAILGAFQQLFRSVNPCLRMSMCAYELILQQ